MGLADTTLYKHRGYVQYRGSTRTMSQDIHIIPVGFDYERLFLPITQGNLQADEVVLINSNKDADETEQDLATNMTERLEYMFNTVLGIDAKVDSLDEIYDYKEVYREAYDRINNHVGNGNNVWINISSMPRTVAFAFATAANTIIVENPDLRDQIHTYYVSPEKYLSTEMREQLESELEYLRSLPADTEGVQERINSIEETLTDVEERGITKGAKVLDPETGDLHVEFPATPLSELRDFEKQILHFLDDYGEIESTSKLAKKLAEQQGEKSDDSFRSKIQYNVKQLEKQGYIKRTEQNNSYRTRLSTMGELWVSTHPSEN